MKNIFRLKQAGTATICSVVGAVRWNYDRAELIADGIVHGVGVFGGLIAATALIVLAGVFASGFEIVTVTIYAAGLLAMLCMSAVYNIWPVSPGKWFLRRFDHSAIYLLIAATYTPVFYWIDDTGLSRALLAAVWCIALIGIAVKVFLPGRFEKLSIGLYLAMGWSGVLAYDRGIATLPTKALWMIAIGGVLYSLGVIFHAWHRLRFQNAIWHAFVLLGAGCHYTAVLDLVLTS
jgi:hemolysin III